MATSKIVFTFAVLLSVIALAQSIALGRKFMKKDLMKQAAEMEKQRTQTVQDLELVAASAGMPKALRKGAKSVAKIQKMATSAGIPKATLSGLEDSDKDVETDAEGEASTEGVLDAAGSLNAGESEAVGGLDIKGMTGIGGNFFSAEDIGGMDIIG